MKDMFHSAALKLTGWYLLIIMLLSIGTSAALYHVSSNDLDRNIHRQAGFFNNYLAPSDFIDFNQLRQKQFDQDRAHLRANLLFFNFIVLLAGGAASYALARRTLRPIEQSHEAQKRFAGDASHELRTPLTAMQTEIEVALRDASLTKKDAVDLLRSNLEEVAKLKRLSEGLLQLANAKEQEESDQVVSAKLIVENAVERVSKVATAKKIKLDVQAKDINLRGSSEHLTDLIAILLDNAIKYSPSGSQVSVSAARKDKKVEIKVSDQGQGISAEDMPHIFDRFYRADSSRTKNHAEGYGLGLAIARRIADLHKVSIEVKSAPGKGATFSVRLPLA